MINIINLNLKATVIYTDNQAVLHIVNNPERKYQQRTKHINIRKEFFKEKQEKGLINIQKISTDENLSDMFTKALYHNRIQYLSSLMGLISEEKEISKIESKK